MLLILGLLLFLSFLQSLASAAFVQTYSCNERLNPLRQEAGHDLLRHPVASVSISDGFIYYRFGFTVNSTINDVNYTTNLYTTLNIQSTFMNTHVFEKSVRLCEYVIAVDDGMNNPNPLHGITPPETTPLRLNTTANNSSIYNSTGTRVPWPSASNIPPLISKRNQKSDSSTSCPLEPGKSYEVLFAAPIENARYFGFYETKFTFLSADVAKNNDIGCFQIYATPYHPDFITYPICFGVMAIFIFGFITNFYIFHFSQHQESDNVFLTVASSICNEPLLNELTPDITTFFNFLQFVLFSCALNLTYPGFLQPIMSYLNWVALIRIDIFSSEFINVLSENGIYKSLGRKGIFGIFPENFTVPNGKTSSDIWKNFMVCSWCVVAIFVIINQFFIIYRQHVTKNRHTSGWKNKFYFTIGFITQFFYEIFALPFISFSCFLILGLAGNASHIQISAAVICILFLIAWLFGIIFFSFKYVLLQKHLLYSSFKIFSCWSSLYHWYKPECSYYVIIRKFIVLFQGFVIGFGQSNGTVQVSLLIFVEIIQLLSLLYIQPYFNKNRNIWGIAISIASLVIISLNIAFIRDLYVSTKIQGIIGDVQLIICSIVILLFLIFFIIRVIQVFRSRKSKKKVEKELDENSKKFKKSKIDDKTVIEEDNSFDHYHEFRPGLESEFQAPLAYHNFRKERLNQQQFNSCSRSRSDSNKSEDSSIVELTDQRVLPGISLKYLNSRENLPAPVSPINDEFLANLSKDDSELRKLWAKRTNFKSNNDASSRNESSDCENGSMFNLKKSATNNGGGGFQVVGKKPIVVESVQPSKSSSPLS